MSDKTIIVGEGYNEGDKYEDKITKILINKKILPTDYKRAGATHRSDIEINYKNKNINVEIKNKNKGADYGQKELKWSKEKKFYWTEKDPNDPVVKLYYRLNIIKKYLNKDYIPRRYSVDIHKLTKIDKQYDLVFVGNMRYAPNVESALFIVNEILPILLKEKPDIKILLSGSSPAKAVLELASQHVTVSGWVDDIRVAYDEAKIFVAPLMLGSGLQNKLLEAMAMGLPCITTPLANNALGAIPEEEILIANNEAEFKIQIERLLSDANLYDKLAKNGHAFVTKNYNWQACNKRLMEVIER